MKQEILVVILEACHFSDGRFTKAKKDETPDEIMEETVKIIETIENEPLKGDVLAAMSILSSEKYSSELVKKYVRREMLMNSPLFEEWVKEEREEAAKKAMIVNTRENILDILAERFDFVPKDIREQLETLNDTEILNELVRKTVKIETLEEFKGLLEKAIK